MGFRPSQSEMSEHSNHTIKMMSQKQSWIVYL